MINIDFSHFFIKNKSVSTQSAKMAEIFFKIPKIAYLKCEMRLNNLC